MVQCVYDYNTAQSVTEWRRYIRSLTSVRFDLGRFDQRGRFVSKGDILTGDVLTMGRFDCGTFWQWDVLTGYRDNNL